MQSLRNKILSTYGYSKLVMLAFAVVVFVDLYLLNRHIQIGQGVTDFREATLEMRRDEKNLFLYDELSNLDQLKLQADAASGALTSGKTAFIAISGEPEFNRIETLLRNYVGEIMQYPRIDAVG